MPHEEKWQKKNVKLLENLSKIGGFIYKFNLFIQYALKSHPAHR